jgi:chromosome segregation ATPase
VLLVRSSSELAGLFASDMRVLIVLSLAAAVTSPVEKVVTVLQNMQDQLRADAKKDAEMNEKMSCWCDTNNAEKTAAVKNAEKSIADLTAAIEAGVAKSSELKTTLEKLAKSIAKSRESLDSATALRTKESGEFTSEEAELSASLKSVSNAVDALAAQNSFLQVKTEVHSGVQAALFGGAEKLSPQQRAALQRFLQQPAGFNSYNSRSGGIFGILSQMKETFTNDLAQARADEKHAQSEYDSLAAAKKREIEAARTMTVDKTEELAATDEDLANAKHDKELTQKALAADEAFLVDLSEKCKTAGDEYAQRAKDRATEISAVGDALKILTDDSARDLFSSTLSFAQLTATSKRQQRAASPASKPWHAFGKQGRRPAASAAQ